MSKVKTYNSQYVFMELKDTTLLFSLLKKKSSQICFNNTDRIFKRLTAHAEIQAS